MRWIPFFVLFYLFSTLQAANLFALGTDYPRLEYLPLLAVFCGLYAPEEAGPMAGLMCGIMYDLLRSQTVGSTAVPLALVAWAIVKIRLNIFREHVVSQFIVTLLAIFAFGLLTVMGRATMVKVLAAPASALGSGEYLKDMAFNALYTSVAAPALFWLMLRMRGMLGFGTPGGRRQR